MIINLTQHPATVEQVEAGVIDLPQGILRESLLRALTFESMPTKQNIDDRAEYIALLAIGNGLGGDYDQDPIPWAAMIGGAPWLMSALESALMDHGIEPLYAFSVRDSAEKSMPDGSVQKINVFRHIGFIKPM